MPVTKSAKKALRQEEKRTGMNKPIRSRMHQALQKAREDPIKENVAAAYSAIDRASKKHIIHKNKAARLKSRLMRVVKKQSET